MRLTRLEKILKSNIVISAHAEEDGCYKKLTARWENVYLAKDGFLSSFAGDGETIKEAIDEMLSEVEGELVKVNDLFYCRMPEEILNDKVREI